MIAVSLKLTALPTGAGSGYCAGLLTLMGHTLRFAACIWPALVRGF